jgi:hypothetical protein
MTRTDGHVILESGLTYFDIGALQREQYSDAKLLHCVCIHAE